MEIFVPGEGLRWQGLGHVIPAHPLLTRSPKIHAQGRSSHADQSKGFEYIGCIRIRVLWSDLDPGILVRSDHGSGHGLNTWV